MSDDGEKHNIDEIFARIIERQDRLIDEHGHACTYVFPTETDPLPFPFVYTVGLSDVDWSELICVAIPAEKPEVSASLSMSVLNAFVRALRATETKPRAGMVLVGNTLNVQIALIKVDEGRVSEFFKGSRHRSMRIGRSPDAVTGLQAVWPDRAGKFPWDAGYDAANFPQELLGAVPAKFEEFRFYDPAAKPPLLGFQITDASGKNIQGDDNDPSGYASFHILNEFEATEVMSEFGHEYSLKLQPIFEGDIEEPVFTDMSEVTAIWPADDGSILQCDPAALVKIAIRAGCGNAAFQDAGGDESETDLKPEDIEFWNRVAANADRIAKWALSGLSISRRALPLADGELESLEDRDA